MEALIHNFRKTITEAKSESAATTESSNKIIVGGEFSQMNGVVRRAIVRVNADGSLDTSFNVDTTNIPALIGAIIVVQPDGKVLLGRGATLSRLNADGSWDASFFPAFNNFVRTVAVQSDGKILVGGDFNGVNNTFRSGIARLNADGTLDTAFNPSFNNNNIQKIIVQPNGQIMVSGGFSNVSGAARSYLVRLNADGSVDLAFNAVITNYSFTNFALGAGGKILIFRSSPSILRRLNSDGTADSTFQTVQTSDFLESVVGLSDGSVILGGRFDSVNNIPRASVAKVKPNGVLDTTFVAAGANVRIGAMVKQSDDKVIVGGEFSKIGGVQRSGIARLLYTPTSVSTRFDFDGDGKADVAVFRPSSGSWYVLPSRSGNFYGFPFGQIGDLITPADFDGDGKTDVGVFRPATGAWYLNRTAQGFTGVAFGANEDKPVPNAFIR